MKELSVENYMMDPCAASSLPYWKAVSIAVPDGMKVVRDDEFEKGGFEGFADEPYFRLIHDLKGLKKPVKPEGFRLRRSDHEEFAAHIRKCYGGGPSADELRGYAERRVYSPELWLALEDDKGEIAATGIAELDRDIGEGVIEWAEVSPEYRRRGLGEYIVRELLWRMNGEALFATVSGRMNSPSNPLRLYEKCGFGGRVIWHVLKEK